MKAQTRKNSLLPQHLLQHFDIAQTILQGQGKAILFQQQSRRLGCFPGGVCVHQNDDQVGGRRSFWIVRRLHGGGKFAMQPCHCQAMGLYLLDVLLPGVHQCHLYTRTRQIGTVETTHIASADDDDLHRSSLSRGSVFGQTFSVGRRR